MKRQYIRRSSAIIADLSLLAALVCLPATNFCWERAMSLSGASAENWFELSRLLQLAEAGCWFVLVAVLVRHVFDVRRLRRGRAPTSTLWIVVAVFVALLSIPALWLLDYHRELHPRLEQAIPVESFADQFPGVPLPDGTRSVVLDKSDLAVFLSSRDRIPFAVRGNRFVRIRPDGFHQLYGSVDIVPADTNLVYIHSCRTRYRTTLRLQGVYW